MISTATWRERLAYQPLSLGAVALATSAALVIADDLTRPLIAAAEQRDLQASLSQVLPAGHAANDMLGDTLSLPGADGAPVTVYRSRRADGRVNAAVFRVAGRGYAGEIGVLLGVDVDGAVLGARVVRHQETPGLGDKIEAAKSKWIDGFKARSLAAPAPERWAVKKDGGDFDQFAGATITPRAVVKAVKGGLEFYAANRERILEGRAE
jgi:electron transport complex protein RnfG